MKDFKDNCLLAAGILVPSCACVIAWLIDGLTGGIAWPIRGGMMVAVLILGGGWFGLLWHRAKATRQAAQRYFEALCELVAEE